MANQNFNFQNTQGNYSTGISNYNEQTYLIPQVDVFEDNSAIHYIYELPGVDSEKLNVELSEDDIFVEAETSAQDQNPKKFLYQERPKGSFFRQMKLPVNVEIDSAEANFTNGLLKITFPKNQ